MWAAILLAMVAIAQLVFASAQNVIPRQYMIPTTTAVSSNLPTITTASILFSIPKAGFAASIIAANPDDTTLVLTCTENEECGTSLLTAAVGHSEQTLMYSDNGVYYTEDCTLSTAIYAACTRYLNMPTPGMTTASYSAEATYLIAGTNMHWLHVPITATGAAAAATSINTNLADDTSKLSSLSTGTKFAIGVVVGTIVAGSLVAGILLLLLRFRRKRQTKLRESDEKVVDDTSSM